MSERINRNTPCPAVFEDLGLIEYGRALNVQLDTVRSKIENPDQPDHIFLLEHPPVFTLGKNGGRENLAVSDEFLIQKQIEVVQTGRGGNITYHAPGQLVMYTVVCLDRLGMDVESLVTGLEEVMIQTALELGIKTQRSDQNRGIWIAGKKIGSIGLGIKKGISFHGIALNINPDLTPFTWINPCGLTNVSMTSVEKELEKAAALMGNNSMLKAKESFKKHFCSIFNYDY